MYVSVQSDIFQDHVIKELEGRASWPSPFPEEPPQVELWPAVASPRHGGALGQQDRPPIVSQLGGKEGERDNAKMVQVTMNLIDFLVACTSRVHQCIKILRFSQIHVSMEYDQKYTLYFDWKKHPKTNEAIMVLHFTDFFWFISIITYPYFITRTNRSLLCHKQLIR